MVRFCVVVCLQIRKKAGGFCWGVNKSPPLPSESPEVKHVTDQITSKVAEMVADRRGAWEDVGWMVDIDLT